MGIELSEEVGIGVGGAKEETVVDMALLGSQSEFLFQGLEGCGLGDGVGHVEIGGDTTCSCSTTLCVDISLLRQAWLTKVDMGVDDTGENKATRSIDDFIIRCFGCAVSYLNYLFILNDQ